MDSARRVIDESSRVFQSHQREEALHVDSQKRPTYVLRMAIKVSDLSVAQLKRALQIKEHIEQLEQELSTVLGGPPRASSRGAANKAPAPVLARSGRKSVSKSAKALAKSRSPAKNKKGTSATTPVKKSAPTKSRMTPAGKAKLSALAKARWKKIRASGKKRF